jgi:hypothetical protein
VHKVNAKLYSTSGSNLTQNLPRCPPPTIINKSKPCEECRRHTTAAAEYRPVTDQWLLEFTPDTSFRSGRIVEMRLRSDHHVCSQCCVQATGHAIRFLRAIPRHLPFSKPTNVASIIYSTGRSTSMPVSSHSIVVGFRSSIRSTIHLIQHAHPWKHAVKSRYRFSTQSRVYLNSRDCRESFSEQSANRHCCSQLEILTPRDTSPTADFPHRCLLT